MKTAATIQSLLENRAIAKLKVEISAAHAAYLNLYNQCPGSVEFTLDGKSVWMNTVLPLINEALEREMTGGRVETEAKEFLAQIDSLKDQLDQLEVANG